jgi:UrcA family protein
MTIRTLAIGLAGLGLAAVAGHAGAQSSDYDPAYDAPSAGEVVVTAPPGGEVQFRTERVRFADLDLNAPGDAHILLTRIHGAARDVCGPDWSVSRDLGDSRDYSACMHRAVATAVDDVDAPTLFDAYRYGD